MGSNRIYFDFETDERHRSTWTPALDISENTSEIVIRAELPGVEKASLALTWKDDVLTIAGIKQRQPNERSDLRYICVERQYGRFRRDVVVRTPVDLTRAAARYTDGLLRISLPKTARKPSVWVIPID